MIECIAPRVFLFECRGCGLHIYSDKLSSSELGCFFCGDRLTVLAEVEKIPEEIKAENRKNLSWVTKLVLLARKLF